MGGGQYSFDVAQEARAATSVGGSAGAFNYSGYSGSGVAFKQQVHALLNVYGQQRECMNDQAIVVALDVTRSRGDDAKVVYRKLPALVGWLELHGYLPGTAISFAAIGDAYSDLAPLQVSQWERDNRLDEALSKVWLEEGGGGTGQESYELAAYYYARHTQMQLNQKGRKGYFFFIGDEGYYPHVSATQVQQVLGQSLSKDLPSAEIFRELQEKFHVFLIFPKKSWQDRKADIDAEIAQRVRSAGGRYDAVDVRVSLLWDTRDDLDIHVIAPSGEEISFNNRHSRCGGELDVDRNVSGETREPVENIRWPQGTAPTGEYRVFVQNFRFHEPAPQPVPFRLEVNNHGQVHHFKGVISPHGETGVQSNLAVCRFLFDPKAVAAPADDPYSRYDDRVVLKQWQAVLHPDHILLLDDPEDIIEVMVGAIGLMEQRVNLDGYLAALHREGGHETQRSRIGKAIAALAASVAPSTALRFDDLPLAR